MQTGERSEVVYLLEDLLEWINKGGFLPTVESLEYHVFPEDGRPIGQTYFVPNQTAITEV
jgi:hypothetical protein